MTDKNLILAPRPVVKQHHHALLREDRNEDLLCFGLSELRFTKDPAARGPSSARSHLTSIVFDGRGSGSLTSGPDHMLPRLGTMPLPGDEAPTAQIDCNITPKTVLYPPLPSVEMMYDRLPEAPWGRVATSSQTAHTHAAATVPYSAGSTRDNSRLFFEFDQPSLSSNDLVSMTLDNTHLPSLQLLPISSTANAPGHEGIFGMLHTTFTEPYQHQPPRPLPMKCMRCGKHIHKRERPLAVWPDIATSPRTTRVHRWCRCMALPRHLKRLAI